MRSPFKSLLIAGAVMYSLVTAIVILIVISAFRNTEDLSRVPSTSAARLFKDRTVEIPKEQPDALPQPVAKAKKPRPETLDTLSSAGADTVLAAVKKEVAKTKVDSPRTDTGNSIDRKSTRLNSSHVSESRMPSSA